MAGGGAARKRVPALADALQDARGERGGSDSASCGSSPPVRCAAARVMSNPTSFMSDPENVDSKSRVRSGAVLYFTIGEVIPLRIKQQDRDDGGGQ